MIIILSFQKSKFYVYFVDGLYVDDHEIWRCTKFNLKMMWCMMEFDPRWGLYWIPILNNISVFLFITRLFVVDGFLI